jgi:hypothetical protein
MHPILWGMLGAFILFCVVIAFALVFVHGRKIGRQQGAHAVSELISRQRAIVFRDELRNEQVN